MVSLIQQTLHNAQTSSVMIIKIIITFNPMLKIMYLHMTMDILDMTTNQ